MLGIYLSFTIIILMIAYAGMEATMRVFAYVDIMVRWQWVQFRMFMMRRKLEQQLIKDLPNFNKVIKEMKEHDQ